MRLAGVHETLEGDPNLIPLKNQIGQVLDGYNKNSRQAMPNRSYIEDTRNKNQQSLIIADEDFGPTNRTPFHSTANAQAPPSNTVIKVYQDDQNRMTRYEIEKSNPNDNVRVMAITERPTQPPQPQQQQYQPQPQANQISGEPIIRMNKKPRTPAKSAVEVDQREISSNQKYDANDPTKSYMRHEEAVKTIQSSNQKVVFVNSTDPRESPKKTPKTVERYIVRAEPTPEPVVPLVQSYLVQPPQPVPQQPPVNTQPQVVPVQPQVVQVQPQVVPVQPQVVQVQPQVVPVQPQVVPVQPQVVQLQPVLQRTPRTSKIPDVKEVNIETPSTYFSNPVIKPLDVSFSRPL
jgi:hypothetical protein